MMEMYAPVSSTHSFEEEEEDESSDFGRHEDALFDGPLRPMSIGQSNSRSSNRHCCCCGFGAATQDDHDQQQQQQQTNRNRIVLLSILVVSLLSVVFAISAYGQDDEENGYDWNTPCNMRNDVYGNDVELSSFAKPLSYDVSLTFDATSMGMFEGSVTVETTFVNARETSCLAIHADRTLIISKITVDDEAVGHSRSLQHKDILLIGPFRLTPKDDDDDATVRIDIDYLGQSHTTTGAHVGMRPLKWGDTDASGTRPTQTQSGLFIRASHGGLRRVFPCFDTPKMPKVPIKTKLVLTKDPEGGEPLFAPLSDRVVALSNLPSDAKILSSISTFTFHEDETNENDVTTKLGTQQFLLVAGTPYHVNTATIAPVVDMYDMTLRSDDTPSSLRVGTYDAIATELGRALETTRAWLNVTEPQPRIRVVLVSDLDRPFLSEPGIILFRHYDVAQTAWTRPSSSSSSTSTTTTTHRNLTRTSRTYVWTAAADQLVGGKLSSSSWTGLSLFRALSRVVADTAMDTYYLNDDSMSGTRARYLERTVCMYDDAFQASKPIVDMPSTINRVRAIGRAIPSKDRKAVAVIRMLKSFASRQRHGRGRASTVFRDAVIRFFSAHVVDGVVDFERLAYAVDNVLGENAFEEEKRSTQDLLSRWTSAPGFPVLEISCDESSQSAHVTQERFFVSPESRELAATRMNTHLPGQGISFGKGWNEGWNVPIVLSSEDTFMSTGQLGETQTVSPVTTCPSSTSDCVFGSIGLNSAPVWTTYEGLVRVPPEDKSEDVCWRDLTENVLMQTLANRDDLAGAIAGELAAAASDPRRDGADAVRVALEYLNATTSEDDPLRRIHLWNVLSGELMRVVSSLEVTCTTDDSEPMRRAMIDRLISTLESFRVVDVRDDETYDAMLRFGLDFSRRLGENSFLAHLFPHETVTHQVAVTQLAALDASADTLDAVLRDQLEFCTSNKNTLQCVQALLIGLGRRSNDVGDAFRSFLDYVVSSDRSSRVLLACLEAAAVRRATRVVALTWMVDTWASLTASYGSNSRRLGEFVLAVTSLSSSEEEMALMRRFEEENVLDFKHSSDRVVTDALERGKEIAMTLMGWSQRYGSALCASL